MSMIAQALAAGFSASKILGFLAKKTPGLAGKIGHATASGYSANQILNFISRIDNPEEYSEFETPHHIQKRHQDKYNKVTKNLATAIGASLALAPSASPEEDTSAQANPEQPNGLLENLSPARGSPSVMGNAPVQPSPPPNINPSMTQNQQGQQPQTSQPLSPQQESLRQYNEMKKKRTLIDQLEQEFESQYGARLKGQEGIAPEITQPPQDAIGVSQEPVAEEQIEPEEIEPPKVKKEKGTLVALPSGEIGEIEDIRVKKALVKDDEGKLHSTNLDELIESPLPQKDLADLYKDLTSGIEEHTGEDVSRMVNFAGYDPDKNQLAFLPHSGALYVYDDINPEDVSFLTDILNVRKTSGKNFIGAWKEGSKSPIGSAMSQLIRRLQGERGGKGKEYSSKFATVYSAIEPAVEAAKEKEKRERNARKKPK